MKLQFRFGWPHGTLVCSVLFRAACSSELESAFTCNGLVLLRSQVTMVHATVVHAFIGAGHLETDSFGTVSSEALNAHPIFGGVLAR